MNILTDSLLLIFLFTILGVAADLAVKNIKYIASELKIRIFTFGILLGLITTLPELSVGINATVDKVASLSAGNLLGGIIVILGLILGVSLLVNRQIVTDGNAKTLIPELLVIFSPIIFGLDGKYSLFDGLAMIALYFAIVFYLYKANHSFCLPNLNIVDKNRLAKATIISITGIIIVLLASNWIVKTTMNLLEYVNISKLAIGALVFAIGTNLPEITIAFTSWRKKTSELCLSHLLSSALSNVLILGILSSISPIIFTLGQAYFILAIFTALVLALFAWFYLSERKMDRREGLILLLVYLIFLGVNFWIMK